MAGASESPRPASLLERVRAGDDPQLLLLAARGLLPLPQAQLIPLQVELAAGDDREITAHAALSLLSLDPRMLAPFLAAGASEAVLAWFAEKSDDPEVIEALLRRRDVPRAILVHLAPRLPPDLQEVLVHRQDAILDEPAIVDALEDNPQLSPYARRRIGEYREHLLPRARPVAGPYVAAVEGEEASDEEAAAAIEWARQQPAGEEHSEREETTGLSEAQIRYLPVPVRMKLSRGAPRALRAILIRDPNPLIAKAVLRSNTFADSEIESIAANRNVDDEVLGEIGARREWVSKYRVALALVQNPRTPLALAVKLVARLSVRDLRNLSRDRNVADAVRSTARRLYTIKRV